MKVIACIEAHQTDVIRKILQHCGLWHPPPPRAPPRGPPTMAARPVRTPSPGYTYEIDPDFLEHTQREQSDQPDLPWEP